MRRPRLKAPAESSVAYYHCLSRVVGREFLLGDEEKEQFVRYMRLYEKLYGLRIVSYVVMSNHFHLLVEVPQRPIDEKLPNDSELVAHVRSCLGDGPATELEWELNHFRGQGNDHSAEELREKWFARMWDVSRYMKVLKQRFTQWFNKRYNRRGTLWEDRFRSVLVEGAGAALKTMAAYIELNPVRAKICDDPKDYRWCHYAEALAGGKRAKEALRWLQELDFDALGVTSVAAVDEKGSHTGPAKLTNKQTSNSANEATYKAVNQAPMPYKEAFERWRCYLFGVPFRARERGEELAKEKEKAGTAQFFRERVSREKSLEILSEGGRLKRSDYLRCRVRYFTDGAALGSKTFIEEVFESSRSLFSEKRETGARSLQGLELEAKPKRLYNLRYLQKDVVS